MSESDYEHYTIPVAPGEENPVFKAVRERKWVCVSEEEADLYTSAEWPNMSPISTLDKVLIEKYGQAIVRPMTKWDMNQFLADPHEVPVDEIKTCNSVIVVALNANIRAKYPTEMYSLEPGSAN